MGKRQGGATRPRQRLVKVQLDPIIWNALQDIATQQARSVHDLVTEIARDSLRVAIHVYIAEFYRSEITGSENPDPKRR